MKQELSNQWHKYYTKNFFSIQNIIYISHRQHDWGLLDNFKVEFWLSFNFTSNLLVTNIILPTHQFKNWPIYHEEQMLIYYSLILCFFRFSVVKSKFWYLWPVGIKNLIERSFISANDAQWCALYFAKMWF